MFNYKWKASIFVYLVFSGFSSPVLSENVSRVVYESDNFIPYVWGGSGHEFLLAKYDARKNTYTFCVFDARTYEASLCPFSLKGSDSQARIFNIDWKNKKVLFEYGFEDVSAIGRIDYSKLPEGAAKNVEDIKDYLRNVEVAFDSVWFGDNEVLFVGQYLGGIYLHGFGKKNMQPRELVEDATTFVLTKKNIWYSSSVDDSGSWDEKKQASIFGVFKKDRESGKVTKLLEGLTTSSLTVSNDDRFILFSANRVRKDTKKFKIDEVYGYDSNAGIFCILENFTSKLPKSSNLKKMKISPSGDKLLYEISNSDGYHLFVRNLTWQEDCRNID